MTTGETNDPQAERLAELRSSARGWHGIQLAVIGYIGLCGVLQGGGARSPSSRTAGGSPWRSSAWRAWLRPTGADTLAAPSSAIVVVVFDHVTIRVSDREASERFYTTVLRTLGLEPSCSGVDFAEWDDFSLTAADEEHPVTRGLHAGFYALDPDGNNVEAVNHNRD